MERKCAAKKVGVVHSQISLVATLGAFFVEVLSHDLSHRLFDKSNCLFTILPRHVM